MAKKGILNIGVRYNGTGTKKAKQDIQSLSRLSKKQTEDQQKGFVSQKNTLQEILSVLGSYKGNVLEQNRIMKERISLVGKSVGIELNQTKALVEQLKKVQTVRKEDGKLIQDTIVNIERSGRVGTEAEKAIRIAIQNTNEEIKQRLKGIQSQQEIEAKLNRNRKSWLESYIGLFNKSSNQQVDSIKILGRRKDLIDKVNRSMIDGTSQMIPVMQKLNDVTQKSVENMAKANKAQKTFKQTGVGKVTAMFVGIVEAIAKVVKYLFLAQVAFEALKVIMTAAGAGLFKTFTTALHQGGKLTHALGLVAEGFLEILRRARETSPIINAMFQIGSALKGFIEAVKDVGYTMKKTSGSAADMGTIFKSATSKSQSGIRKFITILRSFGDLVKNIGDIILKGTEKLGLLGSAGVLAGFLISRAGLAVKSLAQIVNRGIKVKSFDDFLNLLGKIGEKLFALSTYKQIMKDMAQIPMLKPIADSLAQIGGYLGRFKTALQTLGTSPLLEPLRKQLLKFWESTKGIGGKLKDIFKGAKGPIDGLKQAFGFLQGKIQEGMGIAGSFFETVMKNMGVEGTKAFNSVKDAVGKLFNKTKTGSEKSKESLKGFIQQFVGRNYWNVKVFLDTIAKAGKVGPAAFIKAQFAAMAYNEAQKSVRAVTKRLGDGIDALRKRSKVFNALAGVADKFKNAVVSGIGASFGFGRVFMLIKSGVAAFRNLTGMQKKQKKSFQETLQSWAMTFRYVTFAVRTISRYVQQIIGGSLQMAAKLEQQQKKFNVVFGQLSKSYEQWMNMFAEKTNSSRNVLREWLSTFQDTFVPMGFARNEAAQLSQQMVELASHVARFSGLKTADVMRDFGSAIVGNHETVRKFGILITEATIKQELMNMGITKNLDKVSEQTKAQARLNIMLKSSKDAWGAAYREAESFPALLEAVTGKGEEVAATFGKAMQAMGSDVLKTVMDALTNLQSFLEENKEYISNIFQGIAEGASAIVENYFEIIKDIDLTVIGETVGSVLKAIANMAKIGIEVFKIFAPAVLNVVRIIKFLADVISRIPLGLIKLVAGFIALVITVRKLHTGLMLLLGAVGLIKKFIVAIKAAGIAQGIFNAIANANPYILMAGIILAVVGAVAALVIALTSQNKKLKDTKNAVEDLRDATREYNEELWYQREKAFYPHRTTAQLKEELKDHERNHNFIMDILEEEVRKWNQLSQAKQRETPQPTREGKGVVSFPKSLEEARAYYEDQKETVIIIYELLDKRAELERQIALEIKRQNAAQHYGVVAGALNNIINEEEKLITVGHLVKEYYEDVKYSLFDRANLMKEYIVDMAKGWDLAEKEVEVEKKRKALVEAIAVQRYWIAKYLDVEESSLGTIEEIESKIVNTGDEHLKQLVENIRKYMEQEDHLAVTITYWKQLLALIPKATNLIDDYAEKVKAAQKGIKEGFVSNIIAAEATWRETSPQWDDVLKITDLQEQQKVLQNILSKVDLDWFTKQDPTIRATKNFAEIEKYAELVRAQLKYVNDELKKMDGNTEGVSNTFESMYKKIKGDLENEQTLRKMLVRTQWAYANQISLGNNTNKESLEILSRMIKNLEDELGITQQIADQETRRKEAAEARARIELKGLEIRFGTETSGIAQEITDLEAEIKAAIQLGGLDTEVMLMRKQVARLKDDLEYATTGVKSFGKSINDIIGGFVDNLPFSDIIKTVVDKAKAVFAPFEQFAKGISDYFMKIDWVKAAMDAVSGVVNGAATGLIDFISSLGETLVNFLDGLFGGLGTFIANAVSGLVDAISTAMAPVLEVVGPLGEAFGQLISYVIELVLSLEFVQSAFESITTFLRSVVEPLGRVLVAVIRPLIPTILGIIIMVSKWLMPVFQGIGVLLQRLQPLWIAIGNAITSLFNAVSPLIPFILQLVEIVGVILIPVVDFVAQLFDALGGVLKLLQPVLDGILFVFRLVGTVIATVAATFEWLLIALGNFGTFLSNIFTYGLDSAKWGTGIVEADLGKMIADAVGRIWDDKAKETYQSAQPTQMEWNDILGDTKIEDFMSGWEAGLETGTFEATPEGTSASQAVVTRPPDVYITVSIEGATVVEGLNDMRVVTLAEIIDAIKQSTDYEAGLTVKQ